MYSDLLCRRSSPNVAGLTLPQPIAAQDSKTARANAKVRAWTNDLAEEMIKLRSELAASFFETIQRTSVAEIAALARKQRRLEELEQIRSRFKKDRLK